MKYLTLTAIILVMVSIYGCAPKTATVVEAPTPPTPPTAPTKQAPTNPCVTFDDLPGGQRDQVENAYVLYPDFIKEGKYEEAKAYWETAYYGAPGSNGRVKSQFDAGVKIYSYLYSQATTDADKKMYADSAMAIYDKRMECFGDEAYVQGRKGFDMYYTFPGQVADEEIFEMFAKNLKTKGKKADYFIINPMTKLLSDGLVAETIPVEEGRGYAKNLLAAIDYGTANCKGQICDAWKTIESYAPDRLEALEGIDGFYDCEYYASKYYPLYEADPTNCELVELAYRRMLRGGCTAEDPRIVVLKDKKATDCYVAPPAPGLLRQGFDAYNSGNYTEAISHFENFVTKTEDTELKFKYTLLIAKIYYRDIKNYTKSRTYARAAAGINPSSGEPYMLIGKLYASSGPLCGPGTGFDSQVVTWAAIDQWQKAKSIDPSVAAEANKIIAQYQQYMPSKEVIFQRRISAGDSFTVPCWIQEKTTVRTAD